VAILYQYARKGGEAFRTSAPFQPRRLAEEGRWGGRLCGSIVRSGRCAT